MIGWAAVTGGVSLESIVLFAIIFMWTPPHFWALARYRAKDYERVGVPMLPVVCGPDETRRQILLYSVALVPITLLPAFMGFAGVLYAIVTGAPMIERVDKLVQLIGRQHGISHPAIDQNGTRRRRGRRRWRAAARSRPRCRRTLR